MSLMVQVDGIDRGTYGTYGWSVLSGWDRQLDLWCIHTHWSQVDCPTFPKWDVIDKGAYMVHMGVKWTVL